MMMRKGIVVLVWVAGAVGGMPRLARAADVTGPQSYAGGVLARSTVTGDWGGARDDLAENGVTFDSSVTQISQGVAGGGKDGTWQYGGRGDLTGHLDTQKLGLWPGGFLTAELEGNWAKSANGSTGSINAANASQLFPLPRGNNIALPDLSFAQFVSPYAGVVVGKLQTVSNGDENEFAHGKGDTQFLNVAFNINPTLLVVPYSTLGAGAIVLPTADPNQVVVTAMVLSATGLASTDGFDNLNGALYSAAGRVRTNFLDLTGHQLVGAIYSNKSYTSLDQRITFEAFRQPVGPPSGSSDAPTLQAKRDTWVAYYNFDQFLYETDKAAGNGVGLFGRFGASAGNPNPSKYFYSIGFGGKGLIPGRSYDRFGIGYYYDSIENPTLSSPQFGTVSFLRDEWGFEAFYNVALTQWLLLTPDVQVLGPAQRRESTGNFTNPATIFGPHIETATVLGVRVQLVL